MLKAEKEKRITQLEKKLNLNPEENLTEAELDEKIVILDEIIYNSDDEKQAEQDEAIRRITVKYLKNLSENELEKLLKEIRG